MKHKWWKKLSVSAAVVTLLSGPAMNIVGAEEAFTEEDYKKYNLPTDIDPYNRGEEIKAENPAGRAYTSKDFPGYPDDQVLAAHVRLTDVKQNGKMYDSDTWDYYGPQESTTEDKTVAESKDVDNEKEKKEDKQVAKKEEKQPEKKEEKRKQNLGERLPDTATTAWILAVIGVVAVLASIAVKKFRKDK